MRRGSEAASLSRPSRGHWTFQIENVSLRSAFCLASPIPQSENVKGGILSYRLRPRNPITRERTLVWSLSHPLKRMKGICFFSSPVALEAGVKVGTNLALEADTPDSLQM